MNPTTKTLVLTALVAILSIAPVSADDGDAPEATPEEGPCQTFYYTLDPPAYHLDPSCILRPASP